MRSIGDHFPSDKAVNETKQRVLDTTSAVEVATMADGVTTSIDHVGSIRSHYPEL